MRRPTCHYPIEASPRLLGLAFAAVSSLVTGCASDVASSVGANAGQGNSGGGSVLQPGGGGSGVGTALGGGGLGVGTALGGGGSGIGTALGGGGSGIGTALGGANAGNSYGGGTSDPTVARSCSQSQLLCKVAQPICPDQQVPELNAAGNCFTGACVPIESCGCSVAADCPNNDLYTCIVSRKHCSPYL